MRPPRVSTAKGLVSFRSTFEPPVLQVGKVVPAQLPTATASEVKKAYYRLAKETHPDVIARKAREEAEKAAADVGPKIVSFGKRGFALGIDEHRHCVGAGEAGLWEKAWTGAGSRGKRGEPPEEVLMMCPREAVAWRGSRRGA